MSYAKYAHISTADWEFYQKALNPPPGWDWKDEFDPNSKEEIFSVEFEDGVEVILDLVASNDTISLSVLFFVDGDPLDKNYVLGLSCEDEQSLLDQEMVGFLIHDEWHFINYNIK